MCLTQSILTVLPLETLRTLDDRALETSVTQALRLLSERYEEQGDRADSDACLHLLSDEARLDLLIDELEEMAHAA